MKRRPTMEFDENQQIRATNPVTSEIVFGTPDIIMCFIARALIGVTANNDRDEWKIRVVS